MSKRMIDSSIWTNKKYARLSYQARLLLVGIITTADDQGRIDADPFVLNGKLFVFDKEVSEEDIQTWLESLHNNNTIILYKDSEGEQFAQLVNWWDYQSLQYAQPSSFPKPEGWVDRIRYTFTKGQILTCNWLLTDGTKVVNTCDESGVPLRKANDTPKSGDKSGESGANGDDIESVNQVVNQVNNQVNVHPNFIKDKEEDKDKEEEYKGGVVNTRTHEEENPPPFASLAKSTLQAGEPAQTTVTEKEQPRSQPEFRESLSGEYMPGLTRPKRYQMQTSVTQTVSDAQKFGVQPQQFREMVDCLLAGCAKRALADTDSPDGEQVLLHAQSTTLTLVKLDTRFRSVTGIQSIFDSWENNDFRGGTVPSSGQVLEHASKMVAGKVTCERKDKPQAKAEPIVVTEKQFIPDMMKPRAPIYAKVKPQ